MVRLLVQLIDKEQQLGDCLCIRMEVIANSQSLRERNTRLPAKFYNQNTNELTSQYLSKHLSSYIKAVRRFAKNYKKL